MRCLESKSPFLPFAPDGAFSRLRRLRSVFGFVCGVFASSVSGIGPSARRFVFAELTPFLKFRGRIADLAPPA